MKSFLVLSLSFALLVGCSGGDAGNADPATSKDNFSRPMTDAEKPKGNGAPAGVVDPANKKPIGG
jgi:hypothetical protein